MEVTARLETVIKSRRGMIDLIDDERKRQGYSLHGISLTVGYSQNHLTSAKNSGALSVQGAVDYLDTLGMEVIVRRRE